MKNILRGVRGRVWAIVVVMGAVVCSGLALASNLTTVLTFLHVSIPKNSNQNPSVNAVPAQIKAPFLNQSVERVTTPVTQRSTGPRSTIASKTKEGIVSNSIVIQSSTKSQSPNINNVGGDVKIESNSNTVQAPSKE